MAPLSALNISTVVLLAMCAATYAAEPVEVALEEELRTISAGETPEPATPVDLSNFEQVSDGVWTSSDNIADVRGVTPVQEVTLPPPGCFDFLDCLGWKSILPRVESEPEHEPERALLPGMEEKSSRREPSTPEAVDLFTPGDFVLGEPLPAYENVAEDVIARLNARREQQRSDAVRAMRLIRGLPSGLL